MKGALFFVLAFVLGSACSDIPIANPGSTAGGPSAAPATAALSGRIIATGVGADRVVELRDDHGDVTRLLGTETIALANVDGGDVVVWGTWDANPGFVVSEYTVTGMHGRPALDGVLLAKANAFALRLNNGSIREVAGLTEDCVLLLGSRVWVVGWEDATDVQFGIIARG